MSTANNRWAWRYFDRAFENLDRGFDSLTWNDGFHHSKTKMPGDQNGRTINVITARSGRARWRFFKLFCRLSVLILLRGRVTIKL